MGSIKNIKNISDHYIELEKRVSKVRFARIEAAKRLRTKQSLYNSILGFYSILITIIAITFSIVDFTNFNDFENTKLALFKYQSESVLILALSSFITMFTLFVSTKNYGEKTARYQSNYMELTRLLSDIQNLMVYYRLQNYNEYYAFKIVWEVKNHNKDLDKRLAKKYKGFSDKYSALLTQSENHEDIDYKKASLDEIDKTMKLIGSTTSNIMSCDILEYRQLIIKYSDLNHEIDQNRILSIIKGFLLIGMPIILLIILEYFKKYLSWQ